MRRSDFLHQKSIFGILCLGAVVVLAGLGYYIVSIQSTQTDTSESRKVSTTTVSSTTGSAGDSSHPMADHLSPAPTPTAMAAWPTSNAWPAIPATPVIAPNALSLVVSNPRPQAGEKVTVVLYENSASEAVNSVQTKLLFDSALFDLIDTAATAEFGIEAATDISTAGVIRIARATSQPHTGTRAVAVLHFTVNAAVTGSTTVSIDAGSSYIVRSADAGNILQTVIPVSVTFQSR